jgi:hypothetical protein
MSTENYLREDISSDLAFEGRIRALISSSAVLLDPAGALTEQHEEDVD